MGYISGVVKFILLAYFTQALYLWCINNGIGLYFNEVKPGPCRVIPGISCGSEKISITNDGLAFITSGYQGLTNCDKRYIKGALYLFDFNHPNDNVTRLAIEGDSFDSDAFEPHGMDILEATINKDLVNIYVVNHAKHKESIEVFQFSRNKPSHVIHLKTIRNEKFVCLNDIVLVDQDTFYVTNFLKYCHSAFPMVVEMEFILNLHSANIVYYNAGETTVVADNEAFYNGLAISRNQQKLFSMLSKSGNLHVFDRDNTTGLLHNKKQHHIGFTLDNVIRDKFSDNLYVSVAKSSWCIMMLGSNLTDACSSTGAKITPLDSEWNKVEVEELMHLSGSHFVSSISSFAYYKGQYLAGTVFDGLGYCVDKCMGSVEK